MVTVSDNRVDECGPLQAHLTSELGVVHDNASCMRMAELAQKSSFDPEVPWMPRMSSTEKSQGKVQKNCDEVQM
jgi:hypothetical protein